MELWLLLLLLGLVTYFIVKRSVASITNTPAWLLWLVMMTPALIWSAWLIIYGEDKRMPSALLIGPFILCPILYWLLIQLGRKDIPSSNPSPQSEVRDSQPQRDGLKTESAVSESSKVRPINKTEESNLRNCFPWSIYYLQNLEYRPQAVICKGKLRTNPELAYQTVRDNVEAHFGQRFFVVFQEGLNGNPFFALVPNPQEHPAVKQNTEPATRPGVALGLMLMTLLTTTLIGAQIAAGGPVPIRQLSQVPAVLQTGLSYSLSLMAILGVHEMGHYLSAQFYKIRSTLPYFIPVPFFLGTFGAFIQMRSPVPNRKALFDVGIAGPLAGLVVTIPLLIWGLANSRVVEPSEQSGILNFEALNPRFSLLLTLFSKWALGSQFTPDSAIDLHPVAIAGFIGLIVTAFNLMPVGQLDGGHIVHAMYGQRTGAVIGQITRLLLLVPSLMQLMLGVSLILPEFALWGIFLLLMPAVDEPALNDVSELNNQRDFLGLLVLVLLVIIVLPAPKVLTQLLNV